jgi:hypothetical protein
MKFCYKQELTTKVLKGFSRRNAKEIILSLLRKYTFEIAEIEKNYKEIFLGN